MRAMILERIDHRHRILINYQERCRDAIWWSNFSQAVKRNVFSLQRAQTLWALWASHHSTTGCAPLVNGGKLLWWLKNLSRIQIVKSASKIFQFVSSMRHPSQVGDQQGIVLVFKKVFFVFIFVLGQLEIFSSSRPRTCTLFLPSLTTHWDVTCASTLKKYTDKLTFTVKLRTGQKVNHISVN